METTIDKIIEQFKKTRHFTKDALELSANVIADILDKEQQLAFTKVEESWKTRVEALDLKPHTKKYKNEQCAYFVGAMIALNTTHPIWAICISSGRNIIEEIKKVK